MAVTWTEDNAQQESVNALTHGFGMLVSLPAGYAMCRLAQLHRPEILWSCLVYGISLFAMYLFSMLSHAVKEPRNRERVRALDQGVIYTLIAGTFTPFIYAYTSDLTRVLLMSGVWIAAAAGFYSKVFAKHRINNMTSVSYVLLGWIPAMVLFFHVPTTCFLAMALGGVLYTAGTLFLQNDHRNWYFHAVWHVLVILASACHYAAVIYFCVLI